MAPGKRLFCLIAAVALAVFCATTPSDAAREIIAHGDVHLGACNGATAAYVMITPAEDADGLGLGFNDMAASLKNLGEGESGVSFVPDYSELTSNQKSARCIFILNTQAIRSELNFFPSQMLIGNLQIFQ